jgi:hypothetical protein
MSFKKIIKNILPDKIVHYLIYVRDLPKKIQINYSKIIIKFLITNIYDRNKKKNIYHEKFWWFHNFKRLSFI